MTGRNNKGQTVADRKLKITSIEDGGVQARQASGREVDSLDLVDIVKPLPANPKQPAPNTMPAGPDFGWIRRAVIGASLLWLVMVGALLFFVLDMAGRWQNYTPLQWASIAALVLGPFLLILVTAYCLKQLARLSGQAHALNLAASALTTPDKTVIGKSKTMARAISAHIDQVDTRLEAALVRLGAVDDAVQIQAQTIQTANDDVRETVATINQSVDVQKQALAHMTKTLDESMESLSDTLSMHTDNLAKAVQIAEQKIKEARISVEGATAKINSASDIVRSNTVQAASTLSASHEDIKSLGDIIRQRSEELDSVYKKHAGELTAMIEHLRDEQTSLGASMQERLAKMRDLSLSAQASAESLTEASRTGKQTIEALAEAANLADSAVKDRFAEMRDMVQYSTQHAQSISDMAAQRVQDSLELTRKEITRIEAEMAGLQSRIGNKQTKSLELVPDESGKETDKGPSSHGDKKNGDKKERSRSGRRTRLRLKPVIDVAQEKSKKEQGKEEKGKEDHDRQIAHISQTDSETATTGKPDVMTGGTTVREPDEHAPLDLVDRQTDPDTAWQNVENIPPAPSLSTNAAPGEIPGEIPGESPDETPADPQTAPQVSDPDNMADGAVRPTIPIDKERNVKSKSGGLFRNIFKPRAKTDTPSSLDIVDPKKPASQTPNKSGDDGLLADLAQLGLSVNAVVDDGCIIEASNARAASGHEAMSKCVKVRLKNPVEHLVKSLAVNDDLSEKAIIFATRFDRSIETLAANREAIRSKLESEFGRAYLLCDAALNYDRV